jgi:hypothetical protein
MSQLASPAGSLSSRPNRRIAGKYGNNAGKMAIFPEATKKTDNEPEEQSQVLTNRAENRVDPVAFNAPKIVSSKTAVVLHVADYRLYRRTASGVAA